MQCSLAIEHAGKQVGKARKEVLSHMASCMLEENWVILKREMNVSK